jgi:hypothetical protein
MAPAPLGALCSRVRPRRRCGGWENHFNGAWPRATQAGDQVGLRADASSSSGAAAGGERDHPGLWRGLQPNNLRHHLQQDQGPAPRRHVLSSPPAKFFSFDVPDQIYIESLARSDFEGWDRVPFKHIPGRNMLDDIAMRVQGTLTMTPQSPERPNRTRQVVYLC